MQQAAQQVTEIAINKPYALMDDLERLEYLADDLDVYMPCPYPRDVLLSWVAAQLALGIHAGTDAGRTLDIAYEDWIKTMTTQTTLDQKTFALLISTGGLRKVKALRLGSAWGLQGLIGEDWLPVRSARQTLRVWSSLDTLERFCVAAGVKQLIVDFH